MEQMINRFINLDDELFTQFLILKLGDKSDLNFITDAINWVEAEEKRLNRINKIDKIL